MAHLRGSSLSVRAIYPRTPASTLTAARARDVTIHSGDNGCVRTVHFRLSVRFLLAALRARAKLRVGMREGSDEDEDRLQEADRMSPAWRPGRGRARAPWLLLLVVAAAVAWAVAQQLKGGVGWGVVIPAAGWGPVVVAEPGEWVKQDDGQARVCRAQLPLFSRRRGVPQVSTIRDLRSLRVGT